MIRTADLFAGLGGFSCGAEHAGAEVVWAANHWPDAVHWHRRNHPSTHHECQDLQQCDFRPLRNLGVELLLAGPACQGHSQNAQPARAGRGGSHPPDAAQAQQRAILQRSTAWAVIAAAEEARPRTILVENVPDFLRWELYPQWRASLRTLGYSVEEHRFWAWNFGSAQDRLRLIVTARLDKPLELEQPLKPAQGREMLRQCLDFDDHLPHRWSTIGVKPERMRDRMRKAQDHAGERCVWNNVSESLGRVIDGAAPTITTKSGSQLYLLDGERCRLLHPRELARIQGFPDTYHIPDQRALASKLIGNAIPVQMAEGVVRQALL